MYSCRSMKPSPFLSMSSIVSCDRKHMHSLSDITGSQDIASVTSHSPAPRRPSCVRGLRDEGKLWTLVCLRSCLRLCPLLWSVSLPSLSTDCSYNASPLEGHLTINQRMGQSDDSRTGQRIKRFLPTAWCLLNLPRLYVLLVSGASCSTNTTPWQPSWLLNSGHGKLGWHQQLDSTQSSCDTHEQTCCFFSIASAHLEPKFWWYWKSYQ